MPDGLNRPDLTEHAEINLGPRARGVRAEVQRGPLGAASPAVRLPGTGRCVWRGKVE